jgi:hypothetical protein
VQTRPSIKAPPALYGRASEFHSLGEQLKDDGPAAPRKTNRESQSGDWRNSEQGQYLEAEIVFLEDFHDPWKVSSTK